MMGFLSHPSKRIEATRRIFGRRVLALGLALYGCACSPDAPESKTPDLLLVTVDTLRPDYMSMNGYDRPSTPRIDEIVSGGTYFERAVSPVPRTTPALASLMTGAYPYGTGVRRLTDRLPPGVTTLAQVMDAAGYLTLAVVTNLVLDPARGLERGFDRYDMGSNDRSGEQTTNRAIDLMSRHAAKAKGEVDRPVFLWVHYIDPHVPYHPTPSAIAEIDPAYTGPYSQSFGWQRQPGEPADTHRPFPQGLTKREAAHHNALPDQVNSRIRRLYAADVRDVDAQVGRLVDAARERWGDEVVIVFAADHGESLGEHDFYWDHGEYVYSAGSRIPLAFVLPPSHPLHGGRRCPEWVSLVDVVPTLLELLAIAPPTSLGARLDGRSLLECFRGNAIEPVPVFVESGRSFSIKEIARRQRNDVPGRFRAVVLDDWKLIWTPFLPDEEAWQLFDLASDPHEAHDVFRLDHPRFAALRLLLEEWAARTGTVSEQPHVVSARDEAALRELGYVE
jgi:arylsulfatase A-like enzyme